MKRNPDLDPTVTSILRHPADKFGVIVTHLNGDSGFLSVAPGTTRHDDFVLSYDEAFVSLFGVPTLESEGTVADTVVDEVVNVNRDLLVGAL